ncbi:MAG: hypothetical protein ACKVOP_13395 [Sphingomonadaceae bacterium]
MKTLIALAVLMLLSSCGGMQALKPQAGASLPPKPEAATVAPTPTELLNVDDQARPRRSDEVLQRSERRREDTFDLPPQD